MMQFTDVMIDIETLGSNPRAPIIQIGACGFNLNSGEVGAPFSVLVKPDFSYTRPDEATLAFWLKQDDAARLHVAKCVEEGLRAEEAIGRMGIYYSDIGVPSNVWAMPPSFDIVILEHTASHFGLRMPWRYDATRDLRTLERLCGASRDDRTQATVKHDAGADAAAQASTTIKYFRRLMGKL